MRVILYGYGKELKKQKNNIIDCDIVAIADRRAEKLSNEIVNCPLILPKDIHKYTFDYIVITSIVRFESIKQQLVCENNIDLMQIVSLQLLLKNQSKNRREEEQVFKEIPNARIEYRLLSLDKQNELFYDEIVNRFSSIYFDIYLPKSQDTRFKSEQFSSYIVTHKNYMLKKVVGYYPICVGEYSVKGLLSDKDGDNISDLNCKINEMTAIYWVWKNRISKVVGFCHYRRYFYNNNVTCFENELKAETVMNILKEHDVIVHQRSFKEDRTIIEELKMPLSKQAFDEGYDIIIKYMKLYQPTYLDDLETVLKGNTLCYYNMFITTWDIFDEYCNWLFSFLIPAAEEFDVDKYEGQDKRTIGFFAERMLSVWLHHNPKKLKSLPVYMP